MTNLAPPGYQTILIYGPAKIVVVTGKNDCRRSACPCDLPSSVRSVKKILQRSTEKRVHNKWVPDRELNCRSCSMSPDLPPPIRAGRAHGGGSGSGKGQGGKHDSLSRSVDTAGSLVLNSASTLEDWSSSREANLHAAVLHPAAGHVAKTRLVEEDGGFNAGECGASDVHSRGHDVATVEDLFHHHLVQHNGVGLRFARGEPLSACTPQIARHRDPQAKSTVSLASSAAEAGAVAEPPSASIATT